MRTIKPDFFLDDELDQLSEIHQKLFIGLWCLADREGKLQDSPKKIKALVFPYRDYDVDPLLDDLHNAGFIVRYEASGAACVKILRFEKHQKPHPKEPALGLPHPPENVPSREKKLPAVEKHGEKLLKSNQSRRDPALTGIGIEALTGMDTASQELEPKEPDLPLLTVQETEEASTVGHVLKHYLKALGDNGFNARDTPDKRSLIERQLAAGWSREELCTAIDGLTWSDWHMGRDKKTNGKRYCTLDYAIGDAKTIEKWVNEQKLREAS